MPADGLDQLVVGQSLTGDLGDRQGVEREDVVVRLAVRGRTGPAATRVGITKLKESAV